MVLVSFSHQWCYGYNLSPTLVSSDEKIVLIIDFLSVKNTVNVVSFFKIHLMFFSTYSNTNKKITVPFPFYCDTTNYFSRIHESSIFEVSSFLWYTFMNIFTQPFFSLLPNVNFLAWIIWLRCWHSPTPKDTSEFCSLWSKNTIHQSITHIFYAAKIIAYYCKTVSSRKHKHFRELYLSTWFSMLRSVDRKKIKAYINSSPVSY